MAAQPVSPGPCSESKTPNLYELLRGLSCEAVLFVRRCDGRILEANRAAEVLYGFERERLLSLALPALWPALGQGEEERVPLCCHNAAEGEEATHLRADGTPFPAVVRSCATWVENQEIGVVLVTDATRQKQQAAAEALLRAINERIISNQNPNGLFQFLTDELARIFHAPLVWIGLRSRAGHLEAVARSGVASAYLDNLSVRWDDTPEGRGPAGQVLNHGIPQRVDIAQSPEFEPWRKRALAFGLRTLLSVPIRVEDQILGVLHLYGAKVEPPDGTTLQALTTFAAQVGVSMLNLQHLERIRLQSAALEATANAVMIIQSDGRVTWTNPAFTRMTGYDTTEIVGRRLRELPMGADSTARNEDLWESISAGHVWQGEIANRKKDGSLYCENMTVTPLADSSGRITHHIAIMQDVTERRTQQKRIQYLVTHDAQTGLPNRKELMERLRSPLPGETTTSALLLLDVDNFKLINEADGHQAGDQVLGHIATFLTRQIAKGSVFRTGSDDFAILLEKTTPRRARLFAERLRQLFDQRAWRSGQHAFALTASVGLAVLEKEMAAEELVGLAAVALQEAKEKGKNRVAVGRRQDRSGADMAAAHWTSEIKDAIRNGRLVVMYQPVVDLRHAEKVVHAEALVRMRAHDGSLVAPGVFIPIAERFGLMPEIDRAVIQQALSTLRANPGWRVFINLSALTLSDESTVDFILRALQESGVDPARVCFEVTETAALMDVDRVSRRMRELRSHGCRFALDDFGTGFASFYYLRTLPVDYVKLDGSFTCNLDTNATQQDLTRAVVEIAHILKKEVVAEQVERRIDAEILLQMGAEYAQGYLWGRPAPEDRLHADFVDAAQYQL